MNSRIPLGLIGAALFGYASLLSGPAHASALGANTAISSPVLADLSQLSLVHEVRRKRRRGYRRGRGRYRGGYRRGRRHYRRAYRGRRYRHRRWHHRHYYGGYWYAYPWWLGVASYPYYRDYYYAPVRRGRCVKWHRRCVANWGYRNSDYVGCMRFHRCRPR